MGMTKDRAGELESHAQMGVLLMGEGIELAEEIERLQKLTDPNAEAVAYVVDRTHLRSNIASDFRWFKDLAEESAKKFGGTVTPLYAHPPSPVCPGCAKIMAGPVDEPQLENVGEWQKGLHCGLEDRDIHDRYDACDYGFERGVVRGVEWAQGVALESRPPAPVLPDTDGSILAALRESHEAGGNAWDDIDDPEAFVRELHGGSPATVWRSVDDPPKPYTEVQVWPRTDGHPTAMHHPDELPGYGGTWLGMGCDRVEPTHWCPLTQGPEVTT